MSVSPDYQAISAFLELGEGFADAVEAARFPRHLRRFRNQEWAARVGLDTLTDAEWEAHFARFEKLPSSFSRPLALRYHGHQFRSYNPDLGDGRGFLFAQLRDRVDGRLLDLGTKGSGQTPYSRRGDGRLTLKGAVRECLATEMLESLGVPTSKSFSVFETGEELERGDEPSPTRSAVLVRLSHSHVRFGTFQRLAYFGEKKNLKELVDYCMRWYFPHLAVEPKASVPAFLKEVVVRTADLAAAWMLAGFVHGVLNTDNMNVTGESFDYGPYRFLPTYDPQFVAAYFDHTGLYAYGRQPESVLWNLEQLATALSPIAEREALIEALSAFAPRFNVAIVERLLARLGVRSRDAATDEALFVAAFNFLSASQVGFERFFFDWHGSLSGRAGAGDPIYAGEAFAAFRSSIEAFEPTPEARQRLAESYFASAAPCTLLIDEIESIWSAIAADDDWVPFNAKIDAIRAMGRLYGNRPA